MCPTCPETGKQSFRGRAEALSSARFMAHTFRGRGLKTPYRPYFCAHCGYWHLTKAPRRTNHLRRAHRLFWQAQRRQDHD